MLSCLLADVLEFADDCAYDVARWSYSLPSDCLLDLCLDLCESCLEVHEFSLYLCDSFSLFLSLLSKFLLKTIEFLLNLLF